MMIPIEQETGNFSLKRRNSEGEKKNELDEKSARDGWGIKEGRKRDYCSIGPFSKKSGGKGGKNNFQVQKNRLMFNVIEIQQKHLFKGKT